jgi:hypothetical protein
MNAFATERPFMAENGLKTYQQIFKDEQAIANLYHALVKEKQYYSIKCYIGN